ncbi:MAG: phosphoadenosine phosphosulfate reductase family protein [Clostridia bacterium]|nr:phosphoadenosine phosphosulfate reductase family protein [Clostridia bacterium]
MQGQISIFDGTPQSMLNKSIKLIQDFEEGALFRNPLGYVVGYSGGKDSDVLVHLFRRAGVKFCVVHNHTTLDMPETVYYIRRKFKEWEEQGINCKIYYPKTNFWSLCLEKKMLPLRQTRFCCANLKERDDIAELRFALRSFGVRKAESVKRALYRDSIETRNREDYKDKQNFHFDNTEDVKQTGACYTNHYFFVNPLAYWSDDYLWDYIGGERLEVNPLYYEGFKRVGCICCPMASTCDRKAELAKYPRFEKRFVKLADDIIQMRNAQGLPNKYKFKTGAEYFDMWLNNEKLSVAEEHDLLNLSE